MGSSDERNSSENRRPIQKFWGTLCTYYASGLKEIFFSSSHAFALVRTPLQRRRRPRVIVGRVKNDSKMQKVRIAGDDL